MNDRLRRLSVWRHPVRCHAIWRLSLAALLLACAASRPALAGDPAQAHGSQDFDQLPWQDGPALGAVGGNATLQLPKNDRLLAQGQTARFWELTGNLPHPDSTVVVQGTWFAVLSFTDSGHVRDDGNLDPDALLAALRDSDRASNDERVKQGMTRLHTVGWVVPPHYDPQSKHLEWGLKIMADNSPTPIVNYTVRLLGRAGYESVTLVTKPQTLDHDVAELRTLLKGFDFVQGERYAEFRSGDRIAEYGLGALIVGGAAAAAVKTGVGKSLFAVWKLLAAGAVGIVAAVRKFMARGQKA